MRFLVPRVSLIKLLRAVCSGAVPLLRIEASAGCVTLSCGDIEAGCEATVERSGVCFLRHSKLKKLLQTYRSDAAQSATIDIEVRPSGIRVGRTEVSCARREFLLFANPASTPKTLRFREPFVPEEPPPVDLQIHLPLFPTGVDDLHAAPHAIFMNAIAQLSLLPCSSAPVPPFRSPSQRSSAHSPSHRKFRSSPRHQARWWIGTAMCLTWLPSLSNSRLHSPSMPLITAGPQMEPAPSVSAPDGPMAP